MKIDKCPPQSFCGKFIFQGKIRPRLTDKLKNMCNEDKIERIVVDYISGMTDRYAIEKFKESDNLVEISATIYCERNSHKGIIIGQGGRKLKGIGKAAREDMEKVLEKKVYLETFVKVREGWRQEKAALNDFGYSKN